MGNETILHLIEDKNKMYLASNKSLASEEIKKVDLSNVRLYKVLEQPVSDVSENLQGMENILDALQLHNLIYVYILEGTKTGINFYCGIVPDMGSELNKEQRKQLADHGEDLLLGNLEINYNKIALEKQGIKEIERIQEAIKHQTESAVVEGVPGVVQISSATGMQRFVSRMSGEEFVITVYAKPIVSKSLQSVQALIQKGKDAITASQSYTKLKQNTNTDESIVSVADAKTTAESILKLRGEQIQIQLYTATQDLPLTLETRIINQIEDIFFQTNIDDPNEIIRINDLLNSAIPRQDVDRNLENPLVEDVTTTEVPNSHPYCNDIDQTTNFYDPERRACFPLGKTNQTNPQVPPLITRKQGENTLSLLQVSKIDTKSVTDSTQCSNTRTATTSKRKDCITTNSVSQVVVNNQANAWNSYLDSMLLPRLTYGENRGIYVYSVALHAGNSRTLNKLAAAWRGLEEYSSLSSVPMKVFPLNQGENAYKSLVNFTIPRYYERIGTVPKAIPEDAAVARSLYSQVITQPYIIGGYWVSSKELRYMTALPMVIPQNRRTSKGGRGRNLGKPKGSNIITGTAGEGEMTLSAQSIQTESPSLFFAFEEYESQYPQEMKWKGSINPFEFVKGETISQHIDLLKVCFSLCYSFDVILRQKLEAAMYECYSNYGWNFTTNQNKVYGEEAYGGKVKAFPIFSDVLLKTEELIYRERLLKSEKIKYKAYLNDSLRSWTLGQKGELLNVEHSSNMDWQGKSSVVIPMENLIYDSDRQFYRLIVLIHYLTSVRKQYVVGKTEKEKSSGHLIILSKWNEFLRARNDNTYEKYNEIKTIEEFLQSMQQFGEEFLFVEENEENVDYTT